MHAEANTDALTALYARNVDAVYRICYVYLRSRADTEDAVQSVFLRYLQKQPVFRDENHERGWLMLTAKNICRDMLRSWWRRQRVGLDELPEPAVPMREEEPPELLEALLALPENTASHCTCTIGRAIRPGKLPRCSAAGKAPSAPGSSGAAKS